MSMLYNFSFCSQSFLFFQSFSDILAGKYDHLPEAAFYMVGDIDDVVVKAEQLAN